jgi:hypothetical protein
MGMVELVLTVCVATQLSLCEERHLRFAWNGSLRACAAGAQPYIAQWAGEHPKWVPVRWRCDYPGKQAT